MPPCSSNTRFALRAANPWKLDRLPLRLRRPSLSRRSNFVRLPACLRKSAGVGVSPLRINASPGRSGWKWTTGMIGSGNMVNTCLQCGNKF